MLFWNAIFPATYAKWYSEIVFPRQINITAKGKHIKLDNSSPGYHSKILRKCVLLCKSDTIPRKDFVKSTPTKMHAYKVASKIYFRNIIEVSTSHSPALKETIKLRFWELQVLYFATRRVIYIRKGGVCDRLSAQAYTFRNPRPME